MNLGIFAKTFRRPDAQTTLEAVRALGLGYVQFNFECAGLPSMPEAVPWQTVAAVQAAVQATGVRLAAISGTFNMVHPEPAVRNEGTGRLRVVAEAAALLEIPLVTLCTGTRDREDMWRAHPDNQSNEAWADLIDTMERLFALEAGASLTFAIEPEHGNVIVDAARARSLLDALQAGDRLKIILDPANLWEEGRPQHDVLQEAFELLGADLVIAHAKDRGLDGQTCALGRGIVDFDTYFRLLRAADFRGPIIMHGFKETEATESTAFARSRLLEAYALF